VETVEISREAEKVINWRKEWLRLHYTKRNAGMIARDISIDLHFAVDLRKRCDDEELCMRILYGTD
jgi:hypothetical protein